MPSGSVKYLADPSAAQRATMAKTWTGVKTDSRMLAMIDVSGSMKEKEGGRTRIDLANELQLSPSGITRLLDRLEDQGLVGKGECKSDARVSYAILTDAGLAKLRAAAPGHIEDIERRLGSVLSEEEMKTLSELLGRLSDQDGECTPD